MSWAKVTEKKELPPIQKEQAPLVLIDTFDLIREINTRLTIENEYAPPEATDNFRASSIVKLCPREEVLRHIHKVPKIEKIESRLKRTFDFGRAFHTLVQDEWLGPWGMLWGNWLCKQCGSLHEYCQYPVQCSRCAYDKFHYEELSFFNDEYGITAHPDGILSTPSGNIVLEIKTTNGRQFKLVSDIRRAPLEQHIFQINLYMWLTGLKEGIILYFDKDESMLCQFYIAYNETITNMLLKRVQDTRLGITNKVVPEKKVCDKPDCARAKSCPVRKQCFNK